MADRDHPRRCGENALSVPSVGWNKGSPPQVRGKHLNQQFLQHNHRITPAGAGKTLIVSIAGHAEEDHPRRCGENLPDFKFSGDVKGSPPQVRGKLRYNLAKVIQIRITPAGAGKTLPVVAVGVLIRDHPRRCGENFSQPNFVPMMSGSPPQVRGKH